MGMHVRVRSSYESDRRALQRLLTAVELDRIRDPSWCSSLADALRTAIKLLYEEAIRDFETPKRGSK